MTNNSITISFDEISELYGSEHTLLLRLYRHAKQRALQGLDPADLFPIKDLDFHCEKKDLETLQIFGYIYVDFEMIRLIKYDELNPSTEQIIRYRNRKAKNQKELRSKWIKKNEF